MANSIFLWNSSGVSPLDNSNERSQVCATGNKAGSSTNLISSFLWNPNGGIVSAPVQKAKSWLRLISDVSSERKSKIKGWVRNTCQPVYQLTNGD